MRTNRFRKWLPAGPHQQLLAAAATGWGISIAAFAARGWGRAIDDFFITFRYAYNLAHGNGLTFNPGETVFGTTAPGFAVVLAALNRLTTLSIPGLGTLVTALSLWLTALFVLDELARAQRKTEGLLAGSLIALSLQTWPQHGCEMPFVVLLLLLAARLAKRYPAAAGVCAGLAVWCRPEAILGAAILGVHTWITDRRMPRRYALAVSIAVGGILIFDRLAFGSWLPVTLAAKRAQAEWLPGIWAGGYGFWPHALEHALTGPLTAVWLGLGVAGLPVLLRCGGPAVRMLVAYAVATAVAYPILGVAYYPWYSIPVFTALGAGIPATAGTVVRALRSAGGPWRRTSAAAAALGVALPFAFFLPARVRAIYSMLAPNSHYELYRRTGEWLRDNTPPGSTLAYVEVGTIGYFSERSVQDLLGLVTPRSIPFVPKGDMVGAFLTQPTDYFLFNPHLAGFLDPVRQQAWFSRNYREVQRLDPLPGNTEFILVYQRQPGAVFPPPGTLTPPPEPPRSDGKWRKNPRVPGAGRPRYSWSRHVDPSVRPPNSDREPRSGGGRGL